MKTGKGWQVVGPPFRLRGNPTLRSGAVMAPCYGRENITVSHLHPEYSHAKG